MSQLPSGSVLSVRISRQAFSPRRVFAHLLATFRQCFSYRPLRLLLGESMLQRGTWQTVKDYLQPVLQQAALALPLVLTLDDKGRAAVVVGGVYFLLYLLTALATRNAHRLRDLWGGGAAFTGWIFLVTLGVYVVLLPSLFKGWVVPAILGFVVLAILQNLWKPVFLERVDDRSEAALGATVLSIDEQSKALFVAVAAPLLGWSVDSFGLAGVGGLGVLTSLAVLGVLRSQSRA